MEKTCYTFFLAAVLLGSFNASAQKKANDFKGTIITSTSAGGNTREQEYKVFENKVFMQQQGSTVIVDDKVITTTVDLSQAYAMVKSAGMGDDLKGSGKFVLKDTMDINTVLTDNYKIDYTTETKKIQGFDAKKATVTMTSEESGTSQAIEVWYCSEIGPEYSSIPLPGIKGFILEYKVTSEDGNVVEMTTTEIKKGKVKAIDMLLPAGFESISQPEFQEIVKTIQEMMSSGQ